MTFFVYIVQCADKTLYTGCTNNLKKRLHEHNHSPKGAKYTAGRRPVTIVYTESFDDLHSARKREYQIKQMSRSEKIKIIGS